MRPAIPRGHALLAALAAVAGTSSADAAAQVVAELSAPTVAMSTIDFNTLPLGPTNLAAINAAGQPAATLSSIALNANAAPAGVFNLNAGRRALARVGTALQIIDGGGAAAFDAFDATIGLTAPATEFGLAIGDWNGPMLVELRLAGALQASFTTSDFNGAALVKHWQLTGGSFDQIDVRASTIAGNWVLLGLDVPVTPPLVANFTADTQAGPGPLTVNFRDASRSSHQAGVRSWAWDFDGDGTTDSTQPNPTHVYGTCGTYSVSLRVTDAVNAPATTTRQDFVTVDPITADFTAMLQALPSTFRFTDTSAPTPQAWAWDFDSDGTIDSTVQHPLFVAPTGCLSTTVTLTVTHRCRTATRQEAVALAPHREATVLLGGNGATGGAFVGNLFDVEVTQPSGIVICGVQVAPVAFEGRCDLEVWVTEDTFVGKDATPSAWRLIGRGTGTARGGSHSSPRPIAIALDLPMLLPAGRYGCAIWLANPGGAPSIAYTDGPLGPFRGNDVTLLVGGTGIARTERFGGARFGDRVWNGALLYARCDESLVGGYGFYGRGCPGSAGTVGLAPQNTPRLQSTFMVRVDNLPPGGLALMATGLSRTTSNAGPLPIDGAPLGAPGCMLRAAPAATEALLGAPTATWTLAVPNSPALLCTPFFNQVFALDAGANALGITASDAWAGVVGR